MSIENVNILKFVKPNDDHVIFLSSSFCQPCKELLKKIENEVNEIKIIKIVINTDDDAEVEASFDIFDMKNVPTLIKYNDGREKNRSIGLKQCLDNFYSFFTSEINDDDDF